MPKNKMKYNININQIILSQYTELDIKDMAIFDYIYTMCASVNTKIEKERYKNHTWINYDNLIKDMPALKIKSRNSITPRINKLEKIKLITVLRKMIKGHRRVFVRITTKADSVFVETNERVRFDEKRVRETVQDNNTIDNNTIDNIGTKKIQKKTEKFIILLKGELKDKMLKKSEIEEIKNFVSYWTEPNKSKTKLKWELQQTWDTKRRLNTWMSNKNNWRYFEKKKGGGILRV